VNDNLGTNQQFQDAKNFQQALDMLRSDGTIFQSIAQSPEMLSQLQDFKTAAFVSDMNSKLAKNLITENLAVELIQSLLKDNLAPLEETAKAALASPSKLVSNWGKYYRIRSNIQNEEKISIDNCIDLIYATSKLVKSGIVNTQDEMAGKALVRNDVISTVFPFLLDTVEESIRLLDSEDLKDHPSREPLFKILERDVLCMNQNMLFNMVHYICLLGGEPPLSLNLLLSVPVLENESMLKLIKGTRPDYGSDIGLQKCTQYSFSFPNKHSVTVEFPNDDRTEVDTTKLRLLHHTASSGTRQSISSYKYSGAYWGVIDEMKRIYGLPALNQTELRAYRDRLLRELG
jgi:hypothetical protein